MKIKIITSCSFALLFLTTSLPVFALETSSSAGVKKPIVQTRQATTQEIKAIRQETKIDIQNTKLQLKRKQINTEVSKLRANIVSRYDRLLADKATLQTRITERKSRGLDTSAAENQLAIFSTVNYVSHLAAFDAQTALAIASTRVYSQSPELKTSFKDLNADLLALRKVLTRTITSLVSNKTKIPTATTGVIKK